ncbi:hypothetical protein B0H19DRAFT_1213761 [Mycena capillaripes]|nr:hypothetical protein B0H19DRAFT_1213761 [Mycena capillaripes]
MSCDREEFFSRFGVQYTVYAELEYFDIVKWTVIDPMHNLLLGMGAKTQWFSQWIKKGSLRASTGTKPRELNLIHKFLETFVAPPWAGCIPLRVGEPAGGSLTADEYKFATTDPWAMIVLVTYDLEVPMVWEEFLPESIKDHKRAEKDYPKVLQAWKQKVTEAEQAGKPLPVKPKQAVARMQEDEDLNFLRFCTFLRMIIGTTLYGADSCKPNLHWAIHVPEQIHNFGPLHGFWAFLPERLNKVLKNTNSNNWTGGRLEVSMMREFQRIVLMHTVVNTEDLS